jgi:hypothetical protein
MFVLFYALIGERVENMPVVVSSHQPSASMFACMHDASGAALLSLTA